MTRYPDTHRYCWPPGVRAALAFNWLTESPPEGIEASAATVDLLALEAIAHTGRFATELDFTEAHDLIEAIVERNR